MKASTPPLVDVIEAALEDHYHLELEHRVWSCICGHEFGLVTDDSSADVEHREHQASVVLDALTKAGGVQFGVKGEGRVKEYGRDRKNAQLDAKHRRAKLVTRVTGPWTATP